MEDRAYIRRADARPSPVADPVTASGLREAYAADPRFAGICDLVNGLVHAGMRDVCISPGARSTVLALVMANHPDLRAWSHVDERSASFFALGIAKATRRAVAVVSTSGTAAANFFPAVVEAAYSHTPLLLLTADRPPELRECGAPQAIDQIKLYADHAKWFCEVGDADSGRRYFRALGSRAAAIAQAVPPGPVHLNLPFREPLLPGAEATPGETAIERFPTFHDADRRPPPSAVREIAPLLASSPRGIIACGPYDADPPHVRSVAGLARRLSYPLLGDPTSQMRGRSAPATCSVDAYDALLRNEAFAQRMAPDLVLRIGSLPTSKAFTQYLRRHPGAKHVVIDPLGPWNDPLHLADQLLRSDADATCRALLDELDRLGSPAVRSDATWSRTWTTANRRARGRIAGDLAANDELSEGRVIADLADMVPDGSTLYVASSMAIRDLELFWPAGVRDVRFLCNRGANGIDGFVSSALGAAAASAGPAIAVTGDLAFYHDLNGLLAAKRYQPHAVIIVLNNDGGGIFSYLPQTACERGFRDYFLTPHGLDFEAIVQAYGCSFERADRPESFRAALRRAIRVRRTAVIEVPIDHARSVSFHRRLWERAAATAAET